MVCTYTALNPTRRAIFEFDKLIRSIYTLRYRRGILNGSFGAGRVSLPGRVRPVVTGRTRPIPDLQ